MGILDTYQPASVTGDSLLDAYVPQAVYTGDALSVPQTVIGGAIATLGDIATTTWNSLVPEKYEASTEELLSRVNDDAFQVYKENPETIKALSFVGGLVAPIGLSIKGMNMLRGGMKGANWFSEAGRVERLAEAERAFSMAGPMTEEYAMAKRAIYTATAANALTDSLAAEAALNITLNAHPFMEDYYKDFGKNFLISTAFGAGLGTGIGAIIDTGTISKIGAKVEKSLFSAYKENITAVDFRAAAADQITVRHNNIENLQGLLQRMKDPADPLQSTPYLQEGISYAIRKEEARLIDTYMGAASEELQKVPTEIRDHYIKLLADPRFKDADKIKFPKIKLEGLAKGSLDDVLQETTTLFKILQKEGQESISKTDAIYSPVYDKFFSAKEAVNYLNAADLGITAESLTSKKFFKKYGKDWAKLPRDAGEALGLEHSAVVDMDFMKELAYVSTLDAKGLQNIVVAPDDLSRLKAITLRARQLSEEAGAPIELNIRLTKASPRWEVQERVALRKAGLSANYAQELRGLEKEWKDYMLHNSGSPYMGRVSASAEEALQRWIGGSYTNMRRAAALLRHQDDITSGWTPEVKKAAQKFAGYIDEIRNSKQTLNMKKRLLEFADSNGNVWLYRGMHNDPNGHSFLESYTILSDKAAEFGRGNPNAVKLYKVNIDDIIGTVGDFGPGRNKPEILVMPPTRDFGQVSKANLDKIPDELVEITVKEAVDTAKIAGVTTEVQTIKTLDELNTAHDKALRNAFANLRGEGHGEEGIALRTATPKEMVHEIMSGSTNWSASTFKYGSMPDVERALDPMNRSLQISANKNRLTTPEMFANLNARNLQATSQGLIEYNIMTSPSEIVRGLGEKFFDKETRILLHMIDNGILEVTQSGMKSTMFRSANSVLESFEEAGVAAAEIGKKVVHIKNTIKAQFEEPIAAIMSNIAKDKAMLLEANTVLNMNAGIGGQRFYKVGSIWTPTNPMKAKELQAVMRMTDDEFTKLMSAADEAEEGAEALFSKAVVNGKEVNIVSEPVKQLMSSLQDYGRHMYELKNAYNTSVGKGALQDIGLWVPAVNPRDKHIAYVVDKVTKKTSMLYANTLDELNSSISAYKNALIGRNLSNIDIVTKEEQAAYNAIAARHDPLHMTIADAAMFHSGASARAIVPTNTTMLTEILSGYNHYIDDGVNKLVEVTMSDTMQHLKNISERSQYGYSKESLGVIKRLSGKPADPGQVMRNVILGRSNLGEHQAWAEWQQRTEVFMDVALTKIANIMKPITDHTLSKTPRTAAEWDKIDETMRMNGFPNPYEYLDKEFARGRYVREGLVPEGKISSRAITLSNSLAATMLLRFGELAQPYVNAISLPILTSGAVNRKLMNSFAGARLDPNAKFTVHDLMYAGLRLMNSEAGKKWTKIGEERGLFRSIISEANDLLYQQKQLTPGVMSVVEEGLQNKLVQIMSKPSDWTEAMIRKMSFHTGITMAKRAYPAISDEGAVIFARNFMDEAVGNYFAAQRPALFHGTVGTAMGLFQTYMLTLGQQIYRGIENRNWAALGKQLLTQSTIFGASSLPGFHAVSEGIAKNFSDENIDLQTGTFRALSDPLANILLYGIPSNLGPGVVTRGDIQPRVPNLVGGMDNLAAVNFTGQAFQALDHIATAAFTADKNTGRAMLEAISMQSLSRPLARVSELLSGYSVTRKGDTVVSPAEMYTPLSVISRVMATRPLEEIKLREAMHLNTVYGAADREARSAATLRLKQMARSGEWDDDKAARIADIYLRTGTPTGWRSAVNEAIFQADANSREILMKKLSKGSPLSQMIEDLD